MALCDILHMAQPLCTIKDVDEARDFLFLSQQWLAIDKDSRATFSGFHMWRKEPLVCWFQTVLPQGSKLTQTLWAWPGRRGRSLGEVATGVTHTLQQIPSAGLRTEEMGYPAKLWPTTPEGLQPPRNQSRRRFHNILFSLEWNSRAQWQRNGQQAHSSEHNSQVRMCFPEVTVALRKITAIPWRLNNIM